MKLQRIVQSFFEKIFDSKSDYCNAPGFSYYAFISYTEQDEKWAEWLQWNLEHYKIPTKIRSEHKELPKKVRPVFWYKNDLAGAHLNESIRKELEQSKYMIVVCSPASANKEWVNDEVRIFKDELGRGDKIIPFIIDGKIKAEQEDEECLPLPIRDLPREHELRCIDVREYGKDKALVNIVSTLFDIRFDILWNRFKREKQRTMAIYSIVFALCALGLFGCWDYFLHTKYEYFVDMTDCNGLPTGIIQVSNNEAKSHYRLYRFEYRRRTLQRVVYVDCDGNPQNHTNTEFVDRPCIQELSYDNGTLSTIVCKDATTRTMYIMHFSKDKLAVDLKDDNEDQGANFISSSTSVDQGLSTLQQNSYLDQLLKAPSKIARYIYERDEEGYIVKKMYARHNGDNDDIGLDANGISGFEYERDPLHRIVRIRFLDKHYEYIENHVGVAGKKYAYDIGGNLTVAEYVDKDGKLKYNEHHWAKSVDIYDDGGYCIEERVYGVDGKPCISAHGYHKVITTHNKDSETSSCFDIHNNPVYLLSLGSNPGGCSIITTIRNKKGQIIEVQYKDSKGNLCYNTNHVAIIKYEYDDMGLPTGMRNYGIDGRPCLNVSGYFYESRSYNEKGNITENSIYGVNGMPVQNHLGIHRFVTKYDTGYRAIEVHAYTKENLPMPCILFNGAAWIKLGYDGSSRWVSEISFYGIDNNPIETYSLGAKVRCERDLYGQITTYKYYNEDNELSSNFNHCAIVELSYNDTGMETDRRCYDENKTPTSINGVFQRKVSYTETGQIEKICYYDTIQNLKIGLEGWAICKFTYRNGVLCSESYYGENKKRIEINGVHKYVTDIDDCGSIVAQSAYNKELQPTVNMQIGAHKVTNIYDDCRRVVGRNYYDTTNPEPFVSIRCKLNQRGLQTEVASYNESKELVESPINFGVAKQLSKYDSQDRMTYWCATDKSGRKMNAQNGVAESYASYGNNIYEVVCLDSQENLVNNASLTDPYAYMISYMTDDNQRLYEKRLKLLDDNSIETIRDVYCYDSLCQQALKSIRYEGWIIRVYDVLNEQQTLCYSWEDEFDEYIHIVDSIQHEVELKYGKPKFYKYVKKSNAIKTHS